MKETIYKAEIDQNKDILDIERTIYTIFKKFNIDEFDIASIIFDITSVIESSFEAKEKVILNIFLYDNKLEFLIEGKSNNRIFVLPHTIKLTSEFIKNLKEEIAIISSTFSLTMLKNQKQLEEMLKTKVQQLNLDLYESAYYDKLTKLPNRKSFFERLEKVISLFKRIDRKFAILFIDLDGFKSVNDYYGHEAGDIVLEVVANRLKNTLRKHDLVARLGGDEFVAIIEDYKDNESIGLVAEKLIKVIEKPIEISPKTSVKISASIGIAIFPDDGQTKEDLIRFADLSMYEVKKSGKGSYQFFSKEIIKKFEEKHQIEKDLEGAVQRGEFFLLYQPKIDVFHNKTVGVEALIRWKHPKKGIIPNYKWIPIMEETKYLYEIGNFVLHEALKNIYKFNKKFNCNLGVSVNVDAKELFSEYYIKNLDQLEEDKRKILTLELLEREAVSYFNLLKEIIEKLHNLNIRLSYDDFGTGQTSLSYLSEILPDELKIDRSFISEINKSKNFYIVKAILALAKGLEIDIIAEGVEKESELKILKDLGAYKIQGYYFSKPITIEELEKFIETFPPIRK
jgi:diguanylate cyclase (GGDEF)-like protein